MRTTFGRTFRISLNDLQQFVLAVVVGLCAMHTSAHAAEDAAKIRADAQVRLDKAFSALESRDDADSVISAFRSAVETDPKWALARGAYGQALLARGEIEKADVQFTWAVSLAPDDASYKFLLGLVKLRRGLFTQAVGFLSEAHRIKPDNIKYSAALLLAYVQVGRWDRAIQLWGEGALQGLAPAEAEATEVLLNAVQDDIDLALTQAVKAQQRFREDPAFLFLEGLIYEGQGRVESAIAAYERAAGLLPDDYELRRILILMYLETGSYRKAEQMISVIRRSKAQKAQMPLEDKLTIYYDLANAQYQTGRYKLSDRNYGKYRSLIKSSQSKIGKRLQVREIEIDSLAHFANGVIAERKKQYPEAISEYELSIAGDPGFIMAYERLGQSLLLHAELSDLNARAPLLRRTKEFLEKALELDRENSELYMLLGHTTYQLALLAEGQFRQGLLREALFLYGQADIGKREKFVIRVFQAKISDTLGEYRQALRYYTEASTERPNNPDVHTLIGHTLLKLKKYNEAIASFQKASDWGANGKDVAIGTALAYERLGDHSEADVWFDLADQVGNSGRIAVGDVDAQGSFAKGASAPSDATEPAAAPTTNPTN